MSRFLAAGLLIVTFFAFNASGVEEPFPKEENSYVAIAKSKDGDNRFLFLFCANHICEPISSKLGYPKASILALHGTLRQLGAGGLLIVELMVMSSGGLGPAFFVEGGQIITLSGAAATAAVTGTAMYYIDAFNPLEMYRDGVKENEMASAVSKMIDSGEVAIPFYSNADLQQTLKVRDRLEKILNGFN
jgi:hypothetical protein